MLNETIDYRLVIQANIFHRAWRRALGFLIENVPDELAVCEFECRKLQCTAAEAETCEMRLQALNQPRRDMAELCSASSAKDA